MIYLFIGEDNQKKNLKIDEIKRKILISKEAFHFDYEILYGANLKPDELKKSLMAIPAVASKRIILLRSCHKLNQQNKEIILKFIETGHDKIILILDGDTSAGETAGFITKIRRQAEVVDCRMGIKQNIFDMTKEMKSRHPAQALKILYEQLAAGEHPVKIMGALVWFWGKTRSSVSANEFHKGLIFLREADLNIKRSRLPSEYAVEVLVVKLCSLLYPNASGL